MFESPTARRGSRKLGGLPSVPSHRQHGAVSAEQILCTWRGAECQACSNKAAAERIENTLDISDRSAGTPQCYSFLDKFLGSPLRLRFLDFYSFSSEIRVGEHSSLKGEMSLLLCCTIVASCLLVPTLKLGVRRLYSSGAVCVCVCVSVKQALIY